MNNGKGGSPEKSGEKVEHIPWPLGHRRRRRTCRVRWLPGGTIFLAVQIKFLCFLNHSLQHFPDEFFVFFFLQSLTAVFKAELAVFLFAIAAGLNTLTVSGCKYFSIL